jgi:hypothetical protein
VVRRSMCQCDVLFTFYLVTCLAGLCVVCLVHVLQLVQTGVYITCKKGTSLNPETCQTVPTFDPQPPPHTGTLAHRGKPAVDKSKVKFRAWKGPGGIYLCDCFSKQQWISDCFESAWWYFVRTQDIDLL